MGTTLAGKMEIVKSIKQAEEDNSRKALEMDEKFRLELEQTNKQREIRENTITDEAEKFLKQETLVYQIFEEIQKKLLTETNSQILGVVSDLEKSYTLSLRWNINFSDDSYDYISASVYTQRRILSVGAGWKHRKNFNFIDVKTSEDEIEKILARAFLEPDSKSPAPEPGDIGGGR
jgi:hypothetical protein